MRLKEIAGEYGISLEADNEEIILMDSLYRGRYHGEEGLLPLGDPGEDDAVRSVSIAGKIVEKINEYSAPSQFTAIKKVHGRGPCFLPLSWDSGIHKWRRVFARPRRRHPFSKS